MLSQGERGKAESASRRRYAPGAWIEGPAGEAARRLGQAADPGKGLVVLGVADGVAQPGELILLNGHLQAAEGLREAARALEPRGADVRAPLSGDRARIVV